MRVWRVDWDWALCLLLSSTTTSIKVLPGQKAHIPISKTSPVSSREFKVETDQSSLMNMMIFNLLPSRYEAIEFWLVMPIAVAMICEIDQALEANRLSSF